MAALRSGHVQIGPDYRLLKRIQITYRNRAALRVRLNHADVFKLVRVADDYRKGEFGPDTLATIHDLAPKLGAVKIVK